MTEKLNLAKKSVDFHWKTQDLRMFKILSKMEDVESWIVDDTESVATELIMFGKKLEDVRSEKLSDKAEEVTLIMGYVFSGKSIRLLNWLDSNFPGLSFHYVMEARHNESSEASKLLLDRLKIIKNLTLLQLVFQPMRTRLISGLLEDDDDDFVSEDDDD